MDDNTTKVLLTALWLAAVVAALRHFDHMSPGIERLKLDILGVLRLGTGVLRLTLQRRQRRGQHTDTLGGRFVQAASYLKGSFALGGTISTAPDSHDMDVMFVTHFDGDHFHGLQHLIQCKYSVGSNGSG